MNTKNEETKIKRKRVSVSLSDNEFQRLQAVSASEHLSPTAYLKKLASADLKGKKSINECSNETSRNRIWIYLTDKENKKFKSLSDNEGVKKSTLAKNIIVQTIYSSVFVPKTIKDDLDDLKFLISNIANNVNQLAYYSHRLRQLLDETPVLMELQKLSDDVREFIKKRLRETKDDY